MIEGGDKTIEPKSASFLDDIAGDSTEDGAKTKHGEVVYEEKSDGSDSD